MSVNHFVGLAFCASLAVAVGAGVRSDRPADVTATAAACAEAAPGPKVAPGLVGWHRDADEAFAAARTSKKPVLLFQMLGNLDDEFC